MKKKINKIYYHLKNIRRYGLAYEVHFIEARSGIIKNQPINDINKYNEFWNKHPELYEKEIVERYKFAMEGSVLNLKYPKFFTEKIQWLKLYDKNPLKTKLADKYQVRSWIKDKIGEKHLIPIYGVWEHFDDIDFDKLPNTFVLKCNHGSGMNVVVKDKNVIDKNKMKLQFEDWLARNFAYYSFELHYGDIPRRIIAEKYIEELDGALYDYKVHCFSGCPEFIQVIGDRDLKKHTGFQKHYDFEWNDLGWTFADYPDFSYDIKKPECLNEIYELAQLLSAGFNYVRIDFYVIKGDILFGEMTFTPKSGFYEYREKWTKEMDLELGKKILIKI